MNNDDLRIDVDREIFPALLVGEILDRDQIAAVCDYARSTRTEPAVALREIVNGWRGVR